MIIETQDGFDQPQTLSDSAKTSSDISWHQAGFEPDDSGFAKNEIVTAAVLVTTAFRLRDEQGLLRSLRILADAVQKLDLASA